MHFCVPCYFRCCVLAVVDFVVAISVVVVFAVSVEVVVFDGDSVSVDTISTLFSSFNTFRKSPY